MVRYFAAMLSFRYARTAMRERGALFLRVAS